MAPQRRRRRIRSPAAAATPACAAIALSSPASVPDDLIFDILSRLPVKSVCRFRCVSRGWPALVSDPPFVAAHRSRHTEPLVVAVTSSPTGKGFDLRLMDMGGNLVKVTKNVSGYELLSTSANDLTCVTQGTYGRAQVIDPATGRVLLDLPKQPVGSYHKYNYPIFGFGRATPSGTYKMVRIRPGDSYDCNVLTLGDGLGWRLAPLPPTFLSRTQGSLVVANGVMYVLAEYKQVDSKLLCFDLESEQWKKKIIQGPKKVVGPEEWWRTELVCITELNDAVCMVQSELFTTNLWLLTDSDNDTWIKMYAIPIEISTYRSETLRVTHDGDRLIFSRATSVGEKEVIQVYNPHDGTRVVLHGLGGDAINIGLYNLHLDRFVSSSSALRRL